MSSAQTLTAPTKSFSRLPRHVGIIPDGNRRWADARSLPRSHGYSSGIEPAFRLYRLCRELGVEEVSIYGFTQDNTKRPRDQREAFQQACVDAVERFASMDAEFRVVGDTTTPMFPPPLKDFAERTVLGKGGIKVNLLVNYSWRWDIDLLRKNGQLGSADVSAIDLIVRWGGRRRLSGFLPIQSVYADIYVVESLWPDFEPAHMFEALEWYQGQDPTRGG